VVVAALAVAAGIGTPMAAPDRPVDVNKASVEQLTEIPGIGASLATRIVEFREEHGPFKRVDELLKVRGIGEKSLEKIRPHVTVGDSA
jgi:competence protein ComEA